jgi:parallel beta-helix repeat protein
MYEKPYVDYKVSDDRSCFNNITNNRVYGGDTSFCNGIALMGENNNVINNTVSGAFLSISSAGEYNNIIGNTLTATSIGISGNKNDLIINNIINNFGTATGIKSGTNSIIRNNTINVVSGKGIDVTAKYNVTIENNTIVTSSGTGLYVFSSSELISIFNNTVTCGSGVCISVMGASSSLYPKNITISYNTLNTSGNYSITVNYKGWKNETIGIDPNLNNNANKPFSTPSGVINPPSNDFTGEIHNITPGTFELYFDNDGILTNLVNSLDILNFIGVFENKEIIVTKQVKITSGGATFYNSTFLVTESGVWIENLNIINSNNLAIIILNPAEKVTIYNNTITLNHTDNAYGIYVYQSNKNNIISNELYIQGDFLTFGIFLYGAEENIVKDNKINVVGTGVLHTYYDETCIGGDEICIGGDGICVGGVCIGEICIGGECIGDGVNIIPELLRTYGILLLYSSNNEINNNTVNVTSSLQTTPIPIIESTNSLVGIDIYYNSHNNKVIGNTIIVEGYDPFLYGMGVIGSPTTDSDGDISDNNTFNNNNVLVKGNHIATGFIAGHYSNNTVLYNNTILVYSAESYAYGITLEMSQYSNITNNNVKCEGVANYLIELYESNDNTIANNTLRGNGSYSYGIAGYDSSKNKIYNNKINVQGFGSEIPNGTDAIAYGTGGIYLISSSTNNIITDNEIVSSSDYAVNLTDTSNNSIIYNYLKSDANNGDASVFAFNTDNIVERNYIHFFSNVNFTVGESEVNGSAAFNVSVSSGTGDVNNATVEFYIFENGEWKFIGSTLINNGKASFDWKKILSSLGAGNHDIKLVIKKDNFQDYTKISTLKVNKAPLNIVVLDSTAIKGSSITVSAKVTDKYGNPVSNIKVDFWIDMYIDGFYYKYRVGSATSGSDGRAGYTFTFNNLDAGTHRILAEAVESSNYLSQNGTNIGVLTLKDSTSITVKTSKITHGETATITLILKDSKNNPVKGETTYLIFNNNNILSTQTDANGEAIFSISALAVGSHDFVASYDGNDKYAYSISQGSQIVEAVVGSKNPTLPMADLIINTVKKSGNNAYKVTIKNQGTEKSGKTKVKMWFGKKYKIVNIGEINPGQSITIKIKFFKYSTHSKYKKYVQVNFDESIKESSYTNNKVSFKNSDYQRYKVDLKIINIKKLGKNKYSITIKNQGLANSPKFKLKVSSGKKSTIYAINSISAGQSLITTFTYTQNQKSTNIATINYNKAVVESNYNNNVKKFK